MDISDVTLTTTQQTFELFLTSNFANANSRVLFDMGHDTGNVVIDDVGTVINPITLKGQIHGGVAQGAGQILMERIVYDEESGQLLSASLMDYALPHADDLCEIARHIAPPNFTVDVVHTAPVATTVAQGFVLPSQPINPNQI